LDSDGKIFVNQPIRMIRISIGSGTHPSQIASLLQMYKNMAEMVKKMGGKQGLFAQMDRQRGPAGGQMNINSMMQQMARNPQMAQMAQRMMGGGGGGGGMPDLGALMRQLGGGGGMPDLGALGNMFGGLGGALGGGAGGGRRAGRK
jgi:signal recognition particle subunit SRP54